MCLSRIVWSVARGSRTVLLFTREKRSRVSLHLVARRRGGEGEEVRAGGKSGSRDGKAAGEGGKGVGEGEAR